MRATFGDAMGAAFESATGFRWAEYGGYFMIFLLHVVFLALTTQMEHGWAMSVVALVAGWTGGSEYLHYPAFFAYLPVLLSWVESTLYAVPGCIVIPMALLRLYARTDRALSLGAGAGSRLSGAVLPTLLASLLGLGVSWGWQRWLAGRVGEALYPFMPGPIASSTTWAVTTLGTYVVYSLLFYVPVAAVQARATPIRAFGKGVRFGIRTLMPTLLYAVCFALPAIVLQFIIERQSAPIIAKLRPEAILVLLALYAFFTSLGTYLTYGAAGRYFKMARGSE
jgi:hypothetical protein